MRFKKIYMLSIILLLIGSLSGCDPKETKEEKVLKYLENKYNEAFVMETFYDTSEHKFDFQYSGGEGIAHSINNQNIPFRVSISTNTDKEFYDNYSLMKLSYQLDDEFKEILNSDLNYKNEFKSEISSKNRGIEYTSVKEFLKDQEGESLIFLNIIIETNSKENIENSYQTIFNILQKIKAYNPEYYSINVGFVDDIEKENIQNFIKENGLFDGSIDSIYEDIYGYMTIREGEEINTPDDLKEQIYTHE